MVEHGLPVCFELLLSGAQVLHGLVEFGEKGFYAGYYGVLGGKGGKGNGKVFYRIACPFLILVDSD